MIARWSVICLVLALFAGCTARAVDFSSSGTPHCPYCQVAVTPHTDVCVNCENPYRWAAEPVPCWRCGGAKICPVCEGSGKNPLDRSCYACDGQDAECPVVASLGSHPSKLPNRPGGDCYLCFNKSTGEATGECPFCDELGFIHYGTEMPPEKFSERAAR